jgi:tetratricopeptide (TPR) repeat protein
MLGENMDHGRKMDAYLNALQKGVKSEEAFEDSFGPVNEVEKKFFTYPRQMALNTLRLDKLSPMDPKEFPGGPMSQAETDARLGSLFTYTHQGEDANRKISAALTEDPKLAIAHENAGFLYFQQGKDEEAANEFDKAVELDPSSYLPVYYQAMMKYHGKTDADSLQKLDTALREVLRLNPRFAPAVAVRSQILIQQGKLQDAFNTAVQAQQLEPDRAGYKTLAATILLLGNNYTEAVKWASDVAARWTASDSAEALAVVNQARRLSKIEPTADEKFQEAAEMDYAKGTVAVEGRIQSVTCQKNKRMELALLSGGKTLNFWVGNNFGWGFSDTLWYGRDHFYACYHLDGMKAIIRYAPTTNPIDNILELRRLEVLDDLIPDEELPNAN